jgi:hypothetical protein
MTLQTFQELEILKNVAEIKTETVNLWELVHAIRRVETRVNEIWAALSVKTPEPIAPSPFSSANAPASDPPPVNTGSVG